MITRVIGFSISNRIPFRIGTERLFNQSSIKNALQQKRFFASGASKLKAINISFPKVDSEV